jgi:hypothetical protein
LHHHSRVRWRGNATGCKVNHRQASSFLHLEQQLIGDPVRGGGLSPNIKMVKGEKERGQSSTYPAQLPLVQTLQGANFFLNGADVLHRL